jgi:hypothetical protein
VHTPRTHPNSVAPRTSSPSVATELRAFTPAERQLLDERVWSKGRCLCGANALITPIVVIYPNGRPRPVGKCRPCVREFFACQEASASALRRPYEPYMPRDVGLRAHNAATLAPADTRSGRRSPATTSFIEHLRPPPLTDSPDTSQPTRSSPTGSARRCH